MYKKGRYITRRTNRSPCMLDVMILKGTFLSCYIESQNGNEFSEIRNKLVLYFNVDLLKTFLSYKTRHAYIQTTCLFSY